MNCCNTNNDSRKIMQLCEAARLNNDGVSFLVNEDTTSAVRCFQHAISIIKQEIVRVETSSSGIDNDHYHVVEEDIMKGHRKALSPIDACPVSLKRLDSEASFIYNRPLLFKQELLVQLQANDNTESVLSFTSAVVFMNFALACHLESRCRASQAAIIKAGQLYQMILAVLEQIEYMEASRDMMTMLALNNIANIHFEVFDYENTKICFYNAYQILESLECDDSQLTDEEIDGIITNCLLVMKPSTAGAA